MLKNKIKDESVKGKATLTLCVTCVTIVENTSGIPPVIQKNNHHKNEDNITVLAIIWQYENHSSINKLKTLSER